MPKAPRIYTRTGDDGTTGLVGGARVKKNSLRIASYGTLDELSSHIGLARTSLAPYAAQDEAMRRLDGWLAWSQDALFNLGSELATPQAIRWEAMPLVSADDAKALERAIDEAQNDLEPLRNFIHPGGSFPGAYLHVARTVCRRAERLIVTLRDEEPEISADCVRYINRLSDALFVWARWVNHRLHAGEHLWKVTTQPPQPL
ncbi:MAG TPA: cob(I)yrinic acid a,c-diamide adenosyltransferase [Candidatus Baltobacteraceae bacterium]|nr:cob(I)yrinic acid a,c-diamide adenosyltransferase [Candidatus Baltobacteraceae bacterium]